MDPTLTLLKYTLSFDHKPTKQMVIDYYDSHQNYKYKKNKNNYTCIPLYNPFIYQKALVLANIDAVYNLLDMIHIEFFKTDDRPFTYMIITDQQPGTGYVEYMQYRRPNSFGVGYGQWDFSHIDAKQYKPYDGYYMNGTLIENFQTIIENANGDIQEKYKLVICDNPHFMINCLIGLSCSNRHFIVSCDDLIHHADLIYLLSKAFQHISIINPLSCQQTFIIYQYKIENINKLIDQVKKNTYQPAPYQFINWLSQQQPQSIKEDYDWTKIPLVWHIPDYLPPQIKNKVI